MSYPMTYEEYGKRVVELFLENCDQSLKERKLKFLDELLEEDPEFLRNIYGDSCYKYDQRETDKERVFGDYLLKAQPVCNLELLFS